MIYFIECGGRIKIGYSAQPGKRLVKIATDSPFPCTMLGVVEGDVSDEKALHQKFAQYRVSREWFDGSDEIREWISANNIYVLSESTVQPIDFMGFKVPRGAKTEIAATLGVTNSTISQWHKVPAEYCSTVSKITGVPAIDLRPDIYTGWCDPVPPEEDIRTGNMWLVNELPQECLDRMWNPKRRKPEHGHSIALVDRTSA